MSDEPTLLLVEDNADDVILAQRAFRKAGVRVKVDVAYDGVEAIEYLLGEGPLRKLPHFVLLDLKLPRLDGHEVLRRVRSNPRTRRLPVIMLTSSIERQDVARGYDEGANGYVHKPVSFDAFAEAARHVAAYWLDLNHPPPEWA